MAVKIVKHYSASPLDGAAKAAERSLPLIHFDMIWLSFPLTETLYFYRFNCPESYFFDKVVQQLENSLSISLNHFLPLAGKIIFPLSSAAMPVIRYTSGDSVSLTIAVSDANFADVTGNHSRASHEFHHLVPQMPPAVYSDEDVKFSSIAVQVTLFPNQGICLGFTHHHASCDGMSLIGFFEAWASVNKLNNETHLVGNVLPSYDRSLVEDAKNLSAIGWAEAKRNQPTVSLRNYVNLHKFRATFILNEAQIEKLKKLAKNKKPETGRVSSFVAVAAHLWSCIAKSGEETNEDEPEYLTSAVDCRRRLDPPLPENFFGNCLVLMRASTSHEKLRCKEGFFNAVEAIAAATSQTVKQGRWISDYIKNRTKIISEFVGKRVVRIAGATRMDNYGADYGWGRAIKYECIHIDHDDGTVGLYKARDGGVEFQLSLPMDQMDAFARIFNRELYINSNL